MSIIIEKKNSVHITDKTMSDQTSAQIILAEFGKQIVGGAASAGATYAILKRKHQANIARADEFNLQTTNSQREQFKISADNDIERIKTEYRAMAEVLKLDLDEYKELAIKKEKSYKDAAAILEKSLFDSKAIIARQMKTIGKNVEAEKNRVRINEDYTSRAISLLEENEKLRDKMQVMITDRESNRCYSDERHIQLNRCKTQNIQLSKTNDELGLEIHNMKYKIDFQQSQILKYKNANDELYVNYLAIEKKSDAFDVLEGEHAVLLVNYVESENYIAIIDDKYAKIEKELKEVSQSKESTVAKLSEFAQTLRAKIDAYIAEIKETKTNFDKKHDACLAKNDEIEKLLKACQVLPHV
jgi:hypothetical protein